MTERLHVVPEELRRSAGEHRQAAELLAAAPSANAAVLASLESLGPVFAELRDAGRALLDQRRACYEQQAAAHADPPSGSIWPPTPGSNTTPTPPDGCVVTEDSP